LNWGDGSRSDAKSVPVPVGATSQTIDLMPTGSLPEGATASTDGTVTIRRKRESAAAIAPRRGNSDRGSRPDRSRWRESVAARSRSAWRLRASTVSAPRATDNAHELTTEAPGGTSVAWLDSRGREVPQRQEPALDRALCGRRAASGRTSGRHARPTPQRNGGFGTPSCLQIASAVPVAMSLWRGTVATPRADIQTSWLAPCLASLQPWSVRNRSSALRFTRA